MKLIKLNCNFKKVIPDYSVFLICFVVSSLAITISGCSSKKKDKTPPVLSESFVDASLTEEFLVFGYELTPGRFNPAYEIVTSTRSAQVFSATSGKVTSVRYNGGSDIGQDDYEIFVQPSENSIYTIIYDHVRNVAVSKGSSLTPGTVLGDVGWVGVDQGRVELQINNEDSERALCPEDLGTPDFNLAFEGALALNNSSFTPGDPEYFSSVCLQETVIP